MAANVSLNGGIHDISKTQHFVVEFFAILVAVLGTVGNTLTIIAIIAGKLYRQSCYVKILNLSICNLIHCVIFLPLMTLQSFTGVWTHNTAICNAVSFGLYCNLGTELFGYICITLNRYFCVVHHRAYSVLYGSYRILAIEWIITWLIYPVILVFPLFGIWSHYVYAPLKLVCHPFPGDSCTGYCMFVFMFVLLTTLPVILYCYLHIIFIYVRVQRKVDISRTTSGGSSQNSNEGTHLHSHTRTKSEMKMAFTILAVIWMFGTFRLPFIILYMYDPSMTRVDPLVHTLLIYIGSNSNWTNPLIYAYTNKHIRNSLTKTIASWKLACKIKV